MRDFPNTVIEELGEAKPDETLSCVPEEAIQGLAGRPHEGPRCLTLGAAAAGGERMLPAAHYGHVGERGANWGAGGMRRRVLSDRCGQSWIIGARSAGRLQRCVRVRSSFGSSSFPRGA